jgi:hypothetical protein
MTPLRTPSHPQRALRRVLTGCLLAATAAAGAAQWIVDDDLPADFRSIQAAIDAPYVLSGDEILVRPGVYIGWVTLDTKDLAIRSQAGPFVTILDGDSSGSVVSLMDRTSATILDGFTIRNGRGQTGGGVWIYGGGPVVTRNIIEGNRAVGGFLGYGYGGGIEIYGSTAIVTRNVIRGNTALDGGGGIDLYYAGPGSPGTCCPIISQNTIADNVVTAAGGMGGGILAFAAEPWITSSILVGNQAALGGGLYVYRPQGNHDAPDASGSLFFANLPADADSNGGWQLPGSNVHADPRLGPGERIDLYPRSDSPALEVAEAGAPAALDLWGSAPWDSDLDGTARAERGALENRGEITHLQAAYGSGNPPPAVLSWDDSINTAVTFNLYVRDGEPFKADGGSCLAAGLAGVQFTDSATLAPGQVRFYLVTGRGAIEGTRGTRSDGTARPVSPSCPGP